MCTQKKVLIPNTVRTSHITFDTYYVRIFFNHGVHELEIIKDDLNGEKLEIDRMEPELVQNIMVEYSKTLNTLVNIHIKGITLGARKAVIIGRCVTYYDGVTSFNYKTNFSFLKDQNTFKTLYDKKGNIIENLESHSGQYIEVVKFEQELKDQMIMIEFDETLPF